MAKGFEQTLGISIDSVSTLWENAIKEKYPDGVEKKDPPKDVGTLKLGKEKNTGSINIAPYGLVQFRGMQCFAGRRVYCFQPADRQ